MSSHVIPQNELFYMHICINKTTKTLFFFMKRELDTWRSENRQLQLSLKHEESLTQQSVEPLKAHLAELETAVEEQLDK